MIDSIPDRSIQQRHDALVTANDIRHKRRILKENLKAAGFVQARHDVAALVSEPPAWLLSMKLEKLLLAIPTIGESKVGPILWMFDISPRKKIGGLTPRQRRCVADWLARP